MKGLKMIGEAQFEQYLKPIGEKGLRVRISENETLIGMVCFSRGISVNELRDIDIFRAQFFEIGKEVTKGEKSYFYHNPSEYFIGYNAKVIVNIVQATVCKKTKKVHFGPKESIMVSPQGLGIGTYLISRVIEWLKENYPSYNVCPISLSPVDAESPENRARRNAFYKNRGFEMAFTDEHQKSGHCLVKTVRRLNSKENKLQEVCLGEIMLLVSQYAKERSVKLKELEQKYIFECNKFYAASQKKNRLFRKRNEKRFIFIVIMLVSLNIALWTIFFKFFK